MTSQENKYFLEHIKNVMTTIRLGAKTRQQKDSKACTAIRRYEFRPGLY